jgi:hypothetical protein
VKPTASKSTAAIGFLTVVASGDRQLTGGYLLVDASGRPLEFHCTVPIRASRAQEILYGATLESFLYGEQMAATLIRKPKTRPVVVCTDSHPALSVSSLIDIPVLLVGTTEKGATEKSARRALPIQSFAIDSQQVAVAESHASDRATIEAAFAEIRIQFDLAEPFERIRGAIEEAQRQQAA